MGIWGRIQCCICTVMMSARKVIRFLRGVKPVFLICNVIVLISSFALLHYQNTVLSWVIWSVPIGIFQHFFNERDAQSYMYLILAGGALINIILYNVTCTFLWLLVRLFGVRGWSVIYVFCFVYLLFLFVLFPPRL